MNTVDHIARLLRKHNARLIIDPQRSDEIILSIPASLGDNGDIFTYATDYRLGREFPQYAPAQAALLDTEDDLKI